VTAVLYAALAVAAAALVALAFHPSRGDPYFWLAKAAIPGCIGLLLLAGNARAYRLELVFAIAAIGLAILAGRITRPARERMPAVVATLA